MDNIKKVVIIGGGVSGLTAGIFAQKAGYSAVIVEKHTVAGGQLTGWNRAGYHIDNCIHWLTGTNKNTKLYKLWQETGMLDGDEIYQSESLYTYGKNGRTLSLYSDIEKTEREMIALSPQDEKKIKALSEDVKTVQYLMGTGGKKHDEGLKKGLSVRLPRLLKYAFSDVGKIAKNFDNEVIRGFLCGLLTESFSALALLTTFATYTSANGGVPKGGSFAAARRMEERFIRLGGKIATGRRVAKINVDCGAAYSVTAGEEEIAADAVIVTADPKSVFGDMLAAPMPRRLKKSYESEDLKRFSAVQCAFFCDKDALSFSGDYIFETEKRLFKSGRLILREFSHEPSFAKEGKTVLQSMIFVDEGECKDLIRLKKSRLGYEKAKEDISSFVKDEIVRVFPALAESLSPLDVWTPSTYRDYTATEVGSFMSFAFGGGVFPKRASGRIKGVKNVFLATQWQTAPGGLPNAAQCGKRAVKYLDGYFAPKVDKKRGAAAFSSEQIQN